MGAREPQRSNLRAVIRLQNRLPFNGGAVKAAAFCSVEIIFIQLTPLLRPVTVMESRLMPPADLFIFLSVARNRISWEIRG